MVKTTLAGLKARIGRLLLSSVAIILGVAFVTGALIMGNALDERLHDNFARQARGVDVEITPNDDHQTNDEKGKLTQATLDRVRTIPGVAAADGRAFAAIPLINNKGKAIQVHAQVVESQARLREFDLTGGRFPAKPDEIAVDAATVDFFKLAVNQKVSLLGKDDKPMPMTVVGIFSQGYSEGSTSGQYVLLTPEALFAQSTTKQYGAIVVAADAGVSQDQLASRIATALPQNKVQTGAALTAEMLTKVSNGSASVTQFMLVFALISLVVAGMVIYNTFTILIARRTRELALLRCIGADRGQVFRSVLTEAVAMGAVPPSSDSVPASGFPRCCNRWSPAWALLVAAPSRS